MSCGHHDHDDQVNVTWVNFCQLVMLQVSHILASFPALCLSLWFYQTGIKECADPVGRLNILMAQTCLTATTLLVIFLVH